ncbi:MAG: hypothetical protein LUQ35_02230 [Methanoregula sp.]|nr:hypothetical protein [Methanoregula sp.]
MEWNEGTAAAEETRSAGMRRRKSGCRSAGPGWLPQLVREVTAAVSRSRSTVVAWAVVVLVLVVAAAGAGWYLVRKKKAAG